MNERNPSSNRWSIPTLILLAAGVPLFAGDPCASIPAGFLRVCLEPGEQRLISLPFHAFDPAVTSVFSNQLSKTDRILKWNPEIQAYESSNLTLNAGEAVWIGNTQNTVRSIFLAGTVNLEDEHSFVFQPGLNTCGYPFSVPPTSGAGFGSGEWIRADEVTVWTEQRPYDDVFPQSDDSPQIAELDVTGEGRTVTLTIEPAGAVLDIFYKDMTDEPVDFSNDWKIAAANIPIIGKQPIRWTDRGDANRPAPDRIGARYYLVGRADIDLDENGIPDLREKMVSGAEAADTGISRSARQGLGSMADCIKEDMGSYREGTDAGAGNILYVDKATGDDANDGRLRVKSGSHGPVMSINAALRKANSGDRIVIAGGLYSESLNIHSMNVMICPGNGVILK